jgi:hypothetical protein
LNNIQLLSTQGFISKLSFLTIGEDFQQAVQVKPPIKRAANALLQTVANTEGELSQNTNKMGKNEDSRQNVSASP